MTSRLCFAAPLAIAVLLSLSARPASASSFYIDFSYWASPFGVPGAAPSDAFGAAVGVPGTWNNVVPRAGSFMRSFDSLLFDTHGNATSASVSGWAMMNDAAGGSDGSGSDADRLMYDHIGTTGGWQVNVDGLDDGLYDVYLYDAADGRGLGQGQANGVTFESLNGDFASGEFTEGFNFHQLLNVVVSGGNLLIQNDVVTGRGLAGLQIVAVEQLEPVPEPATLMLLGAGLAGVGAAVRRRARRRTERGSRVGPQRTTET